MARRLRADVFGALGDARGRAATLEALAAEVGDGERVALLVQAAHSRLAADELDAAAADVQVADALAPEELEVRTLVAEIAWRRSAWEDVVVRYGELSSESSGAARVEHTRRVAIAADRLGRSDDARAALELAVAAPDAAGDALADAWRELGQLHERLGDHGGAVDCYRRGGADARAPSLPRVGLLRAAAELLHRRMGRYEEAAAALTEALVLDGGDVATLDALDALQSEAGDDAGLFDTLTRKAALPGVAPERRASWLERLGELAAARGNEPAARAAYRQLIEVVPEHATALGWLAADAAARGDDAASAALDLQLVQAASAPAPDRRAARLRLAERARATGQLADAETHLWAAVELSANEAQPPLLVELEGVYRRAERWADLAVVLAHHARVIGDENAQLGLELQRIEVLRGALGTPRLAVEAAQAAIEQHGREPRLVAALAEAARAAGERELLAETVAAQAEVSVEPVERAHLLAEAAALYAASGDGARAGELARALVEVELAPAERLALAATLDDARLALALGRAAAVALDAGEARAEALRFVAARARAAGDDDAERDALVTLWSDGLAGGERERLLLLLEAAGRHDDAARLAHELVVETLDAGRAADAGAVLARLRDAARSDGGVRTFADALALAASHSDDADVGVAWLREAAALRGKLGDARGAAEALVAAQARRPADETLVVEVETLLGGLGDSAQLLSVLELHLDTRDGEARLPIVRKLWRTADMLGDDVAVDRWVAELRRLEPQLATRVDPAALARTITGIDEAELGRNIEAAETRLRTLAAADDVAEVRDARRKLGELYRAAGRRGEAFAELSLVLSEEPSNVGVLEALIEIAEAESRWSEAAELLERLSHFRAAPSERAAMLFRSAEIYLVKLRDKDAASERLLKAVDLDDTHAPTLRRLIDYFWSEGDDGSAAEMAAALDDTAGFAAPETSVGTRARAALATAAAGDLKRAARLGGALDEGNGATALARAGVELLARGRAENEVVAALRIVSGSGGKLAAVRRQLLTREESDADAAALAARLGGGE